MKDFDKRYSIIHPVVGKVDLIHSGSDLALKYKSKQQKISWDLPEPIIKAEVFGETIQITYQFPHDSILKKNLYFSGSSFNFIVPDGICFFIKENIEQWPTIYHRCREGSQVSFTSPESLVVQIHETKRDHNGKYLTDYSFKVEDEVERNVLYPSQGIRVKDFYLYNSPYSGAWPVFLLSKNKLSSAELNSIHPK